MNTRFPFFILNIFTSISYNSKHDTQILHTILHWEPIGLIFVTLNESTTHTISPVELMLLVLHILETQEIMCLTHYSCNI